MCTYPGGQKQMADKNEKDGRIAGKDDALVQQGSEYVASQIEHFGRSIFIDVVRIEVNAAAC